MIKLTLQRLGAAGGSHANPFLAGTLWDVFICTSFRDVCMIMLKILSAPPVHPQAQICYSCSCEGRSLGIPVFVIINTHLYFIFIFWSCFYQKSNQEKNAISCSLGLVSFSSIHIKAFHLLEVRKSYWHRLPKEGSTVNQMEHSEVGLKCPHSIISNRRGDKNPGIWVPLWVSITDPE